MIWWTKDSSKCILDFPWYQLSCEQGTQDVFWFQSVTLDRVITHGIQDLLSHINCVIDKIKIVAKFQSQNHREYNLTLCAAIP